MYNYIEIRNIAVILSYEFLLTLNLKYYRFDDNFYAV